MKRWRFLPKEKIVQTSNHTEVITRGCVRRLIRNALTYIAYKEQFTSILHCLLLVKCLGYKDYLQLDSNDIT